MVRENFRREQDQQDHHKVKRNRSESRHGVPGLRAVHGRLGHQVDFAGGENVGIEHVGQILNGHDLFRHNLGRVGILRHGDARIENGQWNVVGSFADRIQRSVRHVARNHDGVAKHFQLEVRRNRGVRIELELRQVPRHERTRIQV